MTPPQHPFLRWCVAPFRFWDLTHKDGWPSFSKLVTTSVILSYFVGRPIPLGVALTVVSAAHGTKVLLALIQSRSITATETIQAKFDVAAILKRRDPASGVEPSP